MKTCLTLRKRQVWMISSMKKILSEIGWATKTPSATERYRHVHGRRDSNARLLRWWASLRKTWKMMASCRYQRSSSFVPEKSIRMEEFPRIPVTRLCRIPHCLTRCPKRALGKKPIFFFGAASPVAPGTVEVRLGGGSEPKRGGVRVGEAEGAGLGRGRAEGGSCM